jgi:hypothetical protein
MNKMSHNTREVLIWTVNFLIKKGLLDNLLRYMNSSGEWTEEQCREGIEDIIKWSGVKYSRADQIFNNWPQWKRDLAEQVLVSTDRGNVSR